jgi:hypothetical protein
VAEAIGRAGTGVTLGARFLEFRGPIDPIRDYNRKSNRSYGVSTNPQYPKRSGVCLSLWCRVVWGSPWS